MNDGRKGFKKLSELHKTILLLIVYETGFRILKSSFDIRNLIILKQTKAAHRTMLDLSIFTISLSQIDKGCIFPSFVVRNHFNEHTGLLSYTTILPKYSLIYIHYSIYTYTTFTDSLAFWQ